MSEILDIAHEMAKDLYSVGAMDEATMLKVEELCYGKFEITGVLKDVL